VPTIAAAPYMLLATSHGVPSRMMCSSLPQRFVDGCVLALGLVICGSAATDVSSAASATAVNDFANIATGKKRVNGDEKSEQGEEEGEDTRGAW
jgi:hypothetical protein